MQKFSMTMTNNTFLTIDGEVQHCPECRANVFTKIEKINIVVMGVKKDDG